MKTKLREELDKQLNYLYLVGKYGEESITKDMVTYAYKITTLIQKPYLNIVVYSISDDSILIDVYLDNSKNGYTVEVTNSNIYLMKMNKEQTLYATRKNIEYKKLKELLQKGNECILEYLGVVQKDQRIYFHLEQKTQTVYHCYTNEKLKKTTPQYVNFLTNQQPLTYRQCC